MPPHSPLLLAVAVLAALLLLAHLGRLIFIVHGLVRTRRHFRWLTPVDKDDRVEVDEYIEEARAVALACGYEFVNTCRARRRSGQHLRLDLWRSRDGKTLALVSASQFLFWVARRTAFISVLDEGSRVTTSDNSQDGDALGLHGEVVLEGASFRELHTLHENRLRLSGHPAEPLGAMNPLSALEDLDRACVRELEEAGLARHRDELQRTWSYTLRGAWHVMFRTRPRKLGEVHAQLAARIEKTAE